MKVHVVLKAAVADALRAKPDEDLTQYAARLQLRNVNVDRLRRHGVASGDIDEQYLPALRSLGDVEEVEVDSTQHLL
jgi:hypothetical protein